MTEQQNVEPERHDLRALYDAAVTFKQIECWTWMLDSDLFGVQNPETDEIGYCCVLGNLGEVFALAVYLGTKGLEGYRQMQTGMLRSADAVLHVQLCLMASFEDRNELDKRDLNVIKELGLKFRGRNVWPAFRSYLPGYQPWFVTGDEARFLTVALQQALDVALRFKQNRKLLKPPKRDLYLVRTPEQTSEGVVWRDQWRQPEPLGEEQVVDRPVDELRVRRIKQRAAIRQTIWEADVFFAPSPVQETRDQRPYFPYMSLWVDPGSGMILDTQMAPRSEYRAAFRDRLLDMAEQAGMMPKEIHVKSQDVFDLLYPVTSKLGIKLVTAKLKMLDAVRSELFAYFQRF